jgi:hypothetical protein
VEILNDSLNFKKKHGGTIQCCIQNPSREQLRLFLLNAALPVAFALKLLIRMIFTGYRILHAVTHRRSRCLCEAPFCDPQLFKEHRLPFCYPCLPYSMVVALSIPNIGYDERVLTFNLYEETHSV